MKSRLLHYLVCPLDKTPLELHEWEGSSVSLSATESARANEAGIDEKELSREVITGVLLNVSRRVFYPIHDGIPRLLTYPTGVARAFAALHADRISSELAGYSLPDEKAPEGEQTVLRTFSNEWVNYEWDGTKYWNLTPEQMFASMRYMLDLENHPVRGKSVLEVGIGIGAIADYVARGEGAEVVGLDLGYAVDAAYRHFRSNPFLHIVQASAFAPPFRPSTFDLVYSQGVIHHTCSTRTAFDAIGSLPRKGGRLYVWVYSPTSEKRTLLRRVLMVIENTLRPLIWPLPTRVQNLALAPIVPMYMLHQNFIVRRRSPHYVKYGWNHALHAARDRFTPRFVYRHSEEEVHSWFEAAGYADVRGISERPKPNFLSPSFMTATAVDGIRT